MTSTTGATSTLSTQSTATASSVSTAAATTVTTTSTGVSAQLGGGGAQANSAAGNSKKNDNAVNSLNKGGGHPNSHDHQSKGADSNSSGGSGAAALQQHSLQNDEIYDFKSDKEKGIAEKAAAAASNSSVVSDKSGEPMEVDSTGTSTATAQKRPLIENDGETADADEVKRKKQRKDDSNVISSAATGGGVNQQQQQKEGKSSVTGQTRTPSAIGPASNKSGSNTLNVPDRKSPCASPKPGAQDGGGGGPNNTQLDNAVDPLADDSGKTGVGGGSAATVGELNSNAPKVPPLKIVIPQQSNDQDGAVGTRNGKNQSARNHPLPYVVASSNSNDSNSNAGDKEVSGGGSTSRCGSPVSTTTTSNSTEAATTTGSATSSKKGGSKEESIAAGQSATPSGNNNLVTSGGSSASGSGGSSAANVQSEATSIASGTMTTTTSTSSSEAGGRPVLPRVLRSSHRSSGLAVDRNANNASPSQQRNTSSPLNTDSNSNSANLGGTANNQGNNSNVTGITSSNSTSSSSNSSIGNVTGSNPQVGGAHLATATSSVGNNQEQQEQGGNNQTSSSGGSGSGTVSHSGGGQGHQSIQSSQQQHQQTATTTNPTTTVGHQHQQKDELHPRKRKIRASRDDAKGQGQSSSGGGGGGTSSSNSSGTSGSGSNNNQSSSSSSSNNVNQGTGQTHQQSSSGAAATTADGQDQNSSLAGGGDVHPHDQPITNCYQMFLSIRKQIERRQKKLVLVQPKPPQGFKDYLMNRKTYVLAGKASMEPACIQFPADVTQPLLRDLYATQERERHKLKMRHVVEKEKLVLAVEQEILRVHGRAARALANQSLPFSVCTILKDEEVYNILTPEQEEKDPNDRSRYNGRLFLKWLQDVDDKWEKIKVSKTEKQKNEQMKSGVMIIKHTSHKTTSWTFISYLFLGGQHLS